MLVFPNCKINLGLSITGKREDGYHDIQTVFYPVPLTDALEIIHAPEHSSSPLFTYSGIPIEGDPIGNLCIKAWRLLKQDFPDLPAAKIHLHKAIPIGAGLGGGSADAAFTLIVLNEKYGLNLSQDQLASYALQLGSDCPFFILNKPCIATGRGEILQPIKLMLSGYRLILVNPRIHINTGWAFAQLKLNQKKLTEPAVDELLQVVSQPVSEWKNALRNDFEEAVFQKHDQIRRTRDILYEQGALFASMSGSGSTVYGIFDRNAQCSFSFPQNYSVHNFLLQ